jgi:hypothetical protein
MNERAKPTQLVAVRSGRANASSGLGAGPPESNRNRAKGSRAGSEGAVAGGSESPKTTEGVSTDVTVVGRALSPEVDGTSS